MEEMEEQDLEQAPECIESKLACDLAMIPFLGILFYVIFENIASFKLGSVNASKSYWLREGMRRLWVYSFMPPLIGVNLLVLGAIVYAIVHGEYIHIIWFLFAGVFLGVRCETTFYRVAAQIGCVVVVLAIILAMIPSSQCSEKAANDNAAQAMLKSIVTSQATYITQYKRYAPSLAALSSSGILQKDGFSMCTGPGKDSQVISGYIYQMTAGTTWTSTDFYVRCRPESDNAGTFCYSTDNNGRIVTTEAYQ
jgi:competence protein ComGC